LFFGFFCLWWLLVSTLGLSHFRIFYRVFISWIWNEERFKIITSFFFLFYSSVFCWRFFLQYEFFFCWEYKKNIYYFLNLLFTMCLLLSWFRRHVWFPFWIYRLSVPGFCFIILFVIVYRNGIYKKYITKPKNIEETLTHS
jgi:hypothetical protein